MRLSYLTLFKLIISLTFLFTQSYASASDAGYEVSITNITKGQTFTPRLVVTHRRSVSLFNLGEPASNELAILAEDGNTEPLTNLLASQGRRVGDIQTDGGLLEPGQTTTITIHAPHNVRRLSMAAMLIPTNDTFVSLNSARLPNRGTNVYYLQAYDAGTEFNDQNCANMPGPRCGGQGSSPLPADTDEGFVHISNGFHDIGSQDENGNEILGPFVYDWRNPVARLVVRRIY